MLTNSQKVFIEANIKEVRSYNQFNQKFKDGNPLDWDYKTYIEKAVQYLVHRSLVRHKLEYANYAEIARGSDKEKEYLACVEQIAAFKAMIWLGKQNLPLVDKYLNEFDARDFTNQLMREMQSNHAEAGMRKSHHANTGLHDKQMEVLFGEGWRKKLTNNQK